MLNFLDLVVSRWRSADENDAETSTITSVLPADKEMATLHAGMTRDMAYVTQVNNPIGPKTTLVKTKQTIVHTFPATTYYRNDKKSKVAGSASELQPRSVPAFLHGICVSAVSESPEAPAGGVRKEERSVDIKK